MRAASRRITTVGAALVLVGGCGSPAGSASADSSHDKPALHVVASFYPLQYATQRIGGDRVAVKNLTPAGAEPHDLEITARDAASMQTADLVVYLRGFSPAVDAAADDVAHHPLDVAPFADLDLRYTQIEGGQAGDASTDPHFWLDPTRLANVSDKIAASMSVADPQGAATYRANLVSLQADLESLDGEYTAGLKTCANRDIVTSHNAFGYLAQRYDMRQVGITGLTPESEPTPGALADVTEFVEKNHVATIYYETLVSPAIAKTVAAETGASTEVLDPIEGVSGDSQGSDYLEIMRSNLANLRQGQGCT